MRDGATRTGGGIRRVVAGAVSLALAGLSGGLSPDAGAVGERGRRDTYLVELAAAPGSHQALVDALQTLVAGRTGTGGAPVLYRYRHALAGFAAGLTAAEASRLAADPGVAHVWPDALRQPDSTGAVSAGEPVPAGGESRAEAVDLLGLPGGLWARLGGAGHAGEGAVVGVVDTGVHPEHPSFADDGMLPAPPAGWRGACEAGEEFPASACNRKLLGARSFVAGFGAGRLAAGEFRSARDAVGHGSHVASTAVGNHGVHPVVGGNDLGIAAVSGIAPRAHLAVYKACWVGVDAAAGPRCADSDTVAAVDAAVADGVDVLNLSLSSGPSRPFGPLESALLHAGLAGVFVATSAGNGGPGAGTLGAPGDVPWVTAVAATTLPRTFAARATISGAVPVTAAGEPGTRAAPEPMVVTGASVTPALGAVPLVDGQAGARPGEASRAPLCLPGTLDPAVVTGRAVLCRRGVNDRVEKSRVVRDAGGVGMVLTNSGPAEPTVADRHSIPTVHVGWADGMAVRDRLARGAPAELAIAAARAVPAPADQLAEFSSRGPQRAVPDIPKPDLAAPGVSVLAATTPRPANGLARGMETGETFALKSGASMSAAHVSGVAALLTQLHPDWSPTALKSALMTTAERAVRAADRPAGPFETGSGRVAPNRAADAGLVLEVSELDWTRYLAGVDRKSVQGPAEPLPPSDLNLPAISYARFPGAAVTRRVVTSVDGEGATWRVGIEGLPGVAAVAVPRELTLGPGRHGEVHLAFTLAGAPLDAYTYGALVLTHVVDGRTVRLPISIRPARPAPPAGPERDASGPKVSPPGR